MADLSFIHRYEPGSDPTRPPVLLLHGTGGDESDLLALGRAVSPGAALLSPRGKVLENGMPRFFRRLAEGVFDEADVVARAAELARFVGEAREAYGLPAPVALGYSNGANIAAAVLLLHPGTLVGGILLRPMTPLDAPPPARLEGVPVLLVSGLMDPIAPPSSVSALVGQLTSGGAAVRHESIPASHGLVQTDLKLAQGALAA